MVNKNSNQGKFFIILLVIVLGIGTFFRCYNIDKKLYWHDEVYTSIRTAGYNGKEVMEGAFNGDFIPVRNLLKYQSINPERTWQDSWEKLVEHPEHPPLYYVLSRAWQQLFGSSITATRSLSVFFSFLLFPVLFWLCWELFGEVKVGWWAMGIIAISPVQVLYAQEAREYSLLLVTTALSCVALVGAIKRNNWQWWGFNAVALASNFYVSLLGGYVAIAQAIYVFILEKFRFSKVTINYIISGLISLVLFSPWGWNIYTQWNVVQGKTSWTKMTRPFVELLRSWELHLNSAFIDLHPLVNGYVSVRIIGFVVIAIFLCYRFLIRQTKPQTWLLLTSITVIPSLMLILPDLIDGGIKSIMTRYFLPSILCVQIVVAYWLSRIQSWRDLSRSISLILIIFFGIISCAISAQAPNWWNKIVGYHNVAIAATINSYQQPLVITNTIIVNGNHDVNVGDFISLSHLLKDEVSLVLFRNQDIPLVDIRQFSDVLLWNVKEETRLNFERENNCKLELVEGEFYPELWLMKPLDTVSVFSLSQ